jgi:hypothetical protein
MRKQLVWAVILLSTTTACKRGADVIEEQQQNELNQQQREATGDSNPCDFTQLSAADAVAQLRANDGDVTEEEILDYSTSVRMKLLCDNADPGDARRESMEFADDMRAALETTE